MHVVVSWDIAAQGDRWTQINDQLRTQLTQYSWVKPLSTFYIVPITAAWQRDHIISALNQVGQQHGDVSVVVTPVMAGGSYGGLLPQHLWAEVNRRAS